MPIIDDNVRWEQIINFKKDPDSKRKFLALRNWMIEISRGDYNSLELSEKFEHLKAEYFAHINRYKIDTTFGTIKSFAITTTEILEDLVKLNWSNAIKTGFEIFEKSSKLSEIEANALGKEVGYVYDAEANLKKHNSRQHSSNAIACFRFIVRFFFLFSFSPSRENSVPKPRLSLARERQAMKKPLQI